MTLKNISASHTVKFQCLGFFKFKFKYVLFSFSAKMSLQINASLVYADYVLKFKMICFGQTFVLSQLSYSLHRNCCSCFLAFREQESSKNTEEKNLKK